MNILKRVACSILLVAAASLMAAPNSMAQDEQIRIDTALVSVNVSVTDSRGRQVANLDRTRFEVFADNVRQQIAHFADEEAPFSIGIIYDMHPSTRERRASTLAALKQFVRTLRADDNYFVIVFNERGNLALDFVPSVEQVDTHLAGAGQSGADRALRRRGSGGGQNQAVAPREKGAAASLRWAGSSKSPQLQGVSREHQGVRRASLRDRRRRHGRHR